MDQGNDSMDNVERADDYRNMRLAGLAGLILVALDVVFFAVSIIIGAKTGSGHWSASWPALNYLLLTVRLIPWVFLALSPIKGRKLLWFSVSLMAISMIPLPFQMNYTAANVWLLLKMYAHAVILAALVCMNAGWTRKMLAVLLASSLLGLLIDHLAVAFTAALAKSMGDVATSPVIILVAMRILSAVAYLTRTAGWMLCFVGPRKPEAKENEAAPGEKCVVSSLALLALILLNIAGLPRIPMF